jgi:hypothetical protein
LASLIATYVFLLVILAIGVKALHANWKRFAAGFTADDRVFLTFEFREVQKSLLKVTKSFFST